jgi:hypothetical protein
MEISNFEGVGMSGEIDRFAADCVAFLEEKAPAGGACFAAGNWSFILSAALGALPVVRDKNLRLFLTWDQGDGLFDMPELARRVADMALADNIVLIFPGTLPGGRWWTPAFPLDVVVAGSANSHAEATRKILKCFPLVKTGGWLAGLNHSGAGLDAELAAAAGKHSADGDFDRLGLGAAKAWAELLPDAGKTGSLLSFQKNSEDAGNPFLRLMLEMSERLSDSSFLESFKRGVNNFADSTFRDCYELEFGYKRFDLLYYGGRYIGVSQLLGQIFIDKLTRRQMAEYLEQGKFLEAESLESLKAKVDKSPYREAPALLSARKGFNIIKHCGYFYALAQSLGDFNFLDALYRGDGAINLPPGLCMRAKSLKGTETAVDKWLETSGRENS